RGHCRTAAGALSIPDRPATGSGLLPAGSNHQLGHAKRRRVRRPRAYGAGAEGSGSGAEGNSLARARPAKPLSSRRSWRETGPLIGAMFRVMALSVIRDRGALALAFLLPPVIFLIFAAIFASASGGDIRLQVAIGASGQTAFSTRLEAALRADEVLRILPGSSASREAITRLIENGRADVG